MKRLGLGIGSAVLAGVLVFAVHSFSSQPEPVKVVNVPAASSSSAAASSGEAKKSPFAKDFGNPSAETSEGAIDVPYVPPADPPQDASAQGAQSNAQALGLGNAPQNEAKNASANVPQNGNAPSGNAPSAPQVETEITQVQAGGEPAQTKE